MSSILIKNIGAIVTGDLKNPLRNANSIFIDGGIIREIGNNVSRKADRVIDADGITAMPGLIDSHSHPSIGEYTPAQNALSWITNYMHGGVTALISAGELHLRGLPLPPDARTALSLALVTKRCYDNLRPAGVKVHAGTLLLVPGLTEKDFDEIAAAGIRLVKFIFYDYSLLPNGEAERYVKWARARGIIPRGILREIAFLSSVAEVPPEAAICMATGNVGRAHGLNLGLIEEGRPADIVLLHKITGSVAQDALDSFAKGDLPGISMVIIDGEIRVAGRSQQTPPPERAASEK